MSDTLSANGVAGISADYVRSLVDYHWHQAGWQGDESDLLRQFFSDAAPALAERETDLVNDFAGLFTAPSAGKTSPLLANYFLTAGTFLDPALLADRLADLCVGGVPRASAAAIMDGTGMALRKATEVAFACHADDGATCSRLVSALQKLFFFQAALLRDVFPMADSFMSGGFDETTGLPDHRTMLANLVELIDYRRAANKPLAVLIVHVAFSHFAVDGSAYAESEVLYSQAADRLQQALRDTDVIGRFSRNEFLVILPSATSAGVAIMAASKALKALEEPFSVESHQSIARPTAGIALFPEHGTEAETLLHHAEIARDVARKSTERYAVYDEEYHRQNRLRRSLEALLRTALQENELEVWFQPQADLRRGLITGAESLLRWRLPNGAFVAPTHVVSVAEESGLIAALTMWVFNATLRHLAALTTSGIDISVSVNVTPTNLADPELPDFIARALKTWNVPAEKLVVELTESAMITDSERMIATLLRLKGMGLALSVDDFGTGYSSLAYLKRMPLDELKVDQVFVRNMLNSREDERIVRSVIDLAHHFDLKVVAEGVEDLMTLEFLRALGCDCAQGYLIGKPVPVAEFADWWVARKGMLLRDSLV